MAIQIKDNFLKQLTRYARPAPGFCPTHLNKKGKQLRTISRGMAVTI